MTGTPAGGSFSSSIAADSPEYATSLVTGQLLTPPTTNPGQLQLVAPANPDPDGDPSPGGFANVTVTYTKGASSITKSFKIPTFGLSCYIIADANDEWSGGQCGTLTLDDIVYSGSINDPPGALAGTHCTAFLYDTNLQGSGIALDGTKIQYRKVSGNDTWIVVSAFNANDGTPVVAGDSLARDPVIIPLNTMVDLNGNGTDWRAHDTGGKIKKYRLDLFKGIGHSVCQGFPNPITIGACSPSSSKCPQEAIP